VSIQLPRDGIEEGVRAIYRAVAEFNDVYPSLLAEHRQQLAERAERQALADVRRRTDQDVIDRVMREQRDAGP
jgi:hypothetical protein